MNPTDRQTKQHIAEKAQQGQTLYAYEAYTKYTGAHFHGIIRAHDKEEAEASVRQHIDKNHGHTIKWVMVTEIQFDESNGNEIYEICDYQDEY